jgi:hypothetical protein
MALAVCGAAAVAGVFLDRQRAPDARLFAALRQREGDNSAAVLRLWFCGSRATPHVPEIIKAVRENPRIAPDVIPILDRIAPDWATRPEAKAAAEELLARPPVAARFGSEADEPPSPEKLKHFEGAVEFVVRVVPNLKAELFASLPTPTPKGAAAMLYLDAIDPDWASSPEAKAVLPKLVKFLAANTYESHAPAALDRVAPGWPSSIPDEFVPAMVAAWVHEPETGRESWPSAWSATLVPQQLAKITPDWHTLPVARRVIPQLVLGLFTSPPDVSREIELALGKIDPNWVNSAEAKSAVPQVLERLGTASFVGFPRAEEVLDKLEPAWPESPAAKRAVPRLIRSLNWHDDRHRLDDAKFAKRMLERIGWATPAEAKELAALVRAEMPPDVWRPALEQLRHLKGDAAEVSPLLAAKLSAENAELVVSVLDTLAVIDPNWAAGDAAKAQLPALTARFESLAGKPRPARSATELLAAAEALAAVSPEWAATRDAKAIVPELFQLLGLEHLRAGSPWPPRVPPLLDRINPAWRELPAVADAIRANIQRLATPSVREIDAAERLLDLLDPNWPKSKAARQAMPNLILSALSGNEAHAAAARAVLARIDPDWESSPEVKAAVPKLRDVVVEGTYNRVKAIELLNKVQPGWVMTPQGRNTVVLLIRHTTGENYQGRAKAVEALDKLDPDWHARPEAKAAVENLIVQLAWADPAASSSALLLLKRINPNWAKSDAVKNALPRVIELLDRKTKKELLAAVNALRLIGPEARDAHPKLTSLLPNADMELKNAIRAALKSIAP